MVNFGRAPTRHSKVLALRRGLTRAISMLEREKQFNRKVEINAIIRKLPSALKALGAASE